MPTAAQAEIQLIASILNNAGFGTTITAEGVMVWLENRFVSSMEVCSVIEQEIDELCHVTCRRFRNGSIVTVG